MSLGVATPMVSAKQISFKPIFDICSIIDSNFFDEISPSKGHPKLAPMVVVISILLFDSV